MPAALRFVPWVVLCFIRLLRTGGAQAVSRTPGTEFIRARRCDIIAADVRGERSIDELLAEKLPAAAT
jgi:hypothetical protein